MSLSPEQFNQLVTKREMEVHTDAIQKLTYSIAALTNAVDNLSKRFERQEIENISNLEAHKRINRDLYRIKNHSKLNSMKVAEQSE